MTQKAIDPISMRMAAFRRVLQLEAGRGHENKAVVGGMDRFLDRWRSDLTDDGGEHAGLADGECEAVQFGVGTDAARRAKQVA